MKSKYPISVRQVPPGEIIAKALREKFKKMERPTMLAVSGPGGSGKSTFALKLAKKLGNAVVLALDDYKTRRSERAAKNIYGAHPEANDLGLILKHLEALRAGGAIEKPAYCRETGMRHLTEEVRPTGFVIAEGETAMYEDFRKVIDFSIFIDASFETQLNTRFTRDIAEQGYSPQKAGESFTCSNLIEFREHGAGPTSCLCAEKTTAFPSGKNSRGAGNSTFFLSRPTLQPISGQNRF